MGVYIPTYFSFIHQYELLLKDEHIQFEKQDNYQKQSYRNRCFITGPNGKQLLNIPVKTDSSKGKQQTKDIKVENNVTWQKEHFRALQVTYRSSPFFDLLEADLAPIFERKYEYLYDLNMDTFHFVMDTLEIEKSFEFTEDYQIDIAQDYRPLAQKKFTPPTSNKKYIQLFDDRNGFLENLSILDLLFMEGPSTTLYL
ncbi:MAG: hypothetical protein CMB99_07005 [Flavobacteriaceae bacterium]|nr:hypothetical protein [Flavobacteriaceae bacterium]|tara:strand:+ start:29111 stop:29704 length:594 start_codon:yes stop_codon:yes gene_type:complete